MENEANVNLYTMSTLQKYSRDMPLVLHDFEEAHKKVLEYGVARCSSYEAKRRLILKENVIETKFKTHYYVTYYEALDVLKDGFIILGLPDNFDLTPEI